MKILIHTIAIMFLFPIYGSTQHFSYDHLNRQLQLFSPTSPVPFIHFRNTSTTADWILKHDGIKFHIQDESNAGHEILTLQANGNIGIGTVDPLDKLDVRGGVRIRGNIDISHAEDTTSMFIGRNAGGNSEFIEEKYNTFVGVNAGAGFNNTGSTSNSFFGASAGFNNTSLSSNSFFGSHAGYSNEGGDNSFFGASAGKLNTSGRSNSFFGQDAGRSNTTGFSNSFFGHQAGYSNEEGGIANSFFGSNAGLFNTSGLSNSFFGFQAGESNTSGNYNSYFGMSAGDFNKSGNVNSFFGAFTGSNMTKGGGNSFFGASAGSSQTKGTRNTFIGRLADSYSTSDSLDRAIAIGYNSKVACHSCATIGGTGDNAVNVGINIDSPEVRLHIIGAESDGSIGSMIIENQDGQRKMLFDGNEIDVLDDNNLLLQNNSAGDIRLVEGGGNVGIGLNPSASYQLHLSSGQAAKPGGGSWVSSSSDRRLKTNIRSFDDGLEKILKIKPVWYQYIDRFDLPVDRDFVGVIAQEIQNVAPYMVGVTKYKDKDGNQVEYLNFDQNALTFMLINGLQEMKNTIDSQQKELAQLRNVLSEIEILKKKIENIE